MSSPATSLKSSQVSHAYSPPPSPTLHKPPFASFSILAATSRTQGSPRLMFASTYLPLAGFGEELGLPRPLSSPLLQELLLRFLASLVFVFQRVYCESRRFESLFRSALLEFLDR